MNGFQKLYTCTQQKCKPENNAYAKNVKDGKAALHGPTFDNRVKCMYEKCHSQLGDLLKQIIVDFEARIQSMTTRLKDKDLPEIQRAHFRKVVKDRTAQLKRLRKIDPKNITLQQARSIYMAN
jgi:hypothetical protein